MWKIPAAALVLLPMAASAQQAPTGAMVQTTVTCANTSTAVLTAQSVQKFLLIQNPGASSVWIRFDGAAATTAAPALSLAGGASITWSPNNGFVPGTAINCIVASGTQAISVLYW